MLIINAIEITNFRSITKLSTKINPNSLNIIVGKNDIGKSNFLKALNLFFNGETEIGSKFRFNDDFSKFAKVPNKKAAEITIRITFNTPARFKNNDDLIWTKTWRKDGEHDDYIVTSDREIPKGNDGGLQWLKKIKFKYVPAVRGFEYFNYLMGDLHDALSEINPKTFNEASNKFIEELKVEVNSLIDQITQNLGYTSQIAMPSDFKSLFSTLDFIFDKEGSSISLNKRGDGIKAQHIPVILKFIANHYKTISGRAIISPETIWGFEEPENNMEMGNAFKMAKVFLNFSNDIQIFINTHSPAYYSLAKEAPSKTNLYLAKTTDINSGTQLLQVEVGDAKIFDEEMGILPVITDYVKEEIELRQQAERKAEELSKLKSNTKCLVLTEDSDTNLCEVIFEAQGFDKKTTEFISYGSRSNLLAAMQSCKIKLTDKPDLKYIVFHRDRDVYDGDELDKDKIQERIDKLNADGLYKFHLFLTQGYDLESYFLNPEHVIELYPDLNANIVTQLIEQSTVETHDKSMGKLYEKLDLFKKVHGLQSNAKAIKQLQELYNSNPERYRYGKTVLGELSSKIQKLKKRNINLIKPSSVLRIRELKAIAQKLNK